MKTRVDRRHRPSTIRTRVAALAVLSLAGHAGCGREFYREWANQDVSEAVFEKSRDPRWRLDMFSIEPPALARYANPYDPDRPPAPPDDRAAEATSPVPQWPDNRLIVPVEGTAYLDMLETWTRQRANSSGYDPNNAAPSPGPMNGGGPPAASTAPAGSGYSGQPDASAPPNPPAPTPPAAGTPSPFLPEPGTAPPAANPTSIPNPGTGAAGMTPNTLPESQPPGPQPSNPPTEAPQAQNPARQRDYGVMLSAFQQSGLPLPVPAGDAGPVPATTAEPPAPSPGAPPIGMDPNPTDRDLSQPVNPRPDLTPDQYRASEGLASEITSNLVPKPISFDEAEAAGLPRNSRPYVINMSQAFTLALINARAYQTNLENVYLNALPVTLQRFAFTPQFYAGVSPLTGVAGGGFPPPNLPNQFNYSTAETGAQVSALNLGAVAGFGKFFQSGARLLAGFASQVIFNFAGNNGSQPTVRSYLPLTLVQPFLRGGGRAVTLEPLTNAERNLLYSIRSFAKFRQEFIVATLVGGSVVTNLGVSAAAQGVGFSGGGNSDPAVGFLNVVEDIQLVENTRRNIAAFEQYRTVYAELIKGESSGLTQLQLDQVDQQLQNARQTLVNSRNTYRNDLDNFKLQMGLPPDTPIMPDRGIVQIFKDVYDQVDEWQRNPRRELSELTKFAARLPKVPDVVIDGRSVLAIYNEGRDNEDKLEELLLAGERTALEHRLDLMNTRAQLYDSWRQIKVAANALMGALNISLTNTILTPPTSTNPFGFVDQAKSFSLVINGELPLVRLSERNAFRTALVNYERQRRALMSQEDLVKIQIRNDIRTLHAAYLTYEIAKRNFVLLIRQKDQAFEQIIAPPAGAAGAGNANGAVQTNNLISAQGSLIQVENTLISSWYNYISSRLFLFRDLGTLPYDEWEAFHELFPEEPISTGASAAASGAGATRAAATSPEPEAAGVRR